MDWSELELRIEGELSKSFETKIAYSTDASIYRKLPMGVVFPKHKEDIQEIVKFAAGQGLNLIPRAAGTSLAGQCVGEGLVVDTGKHLNRILDINLEEEWVEVEPGVIRNELNRYLQPYGYFFGPNTSTASRCMMGGMLGNNSSGTTSIKYGVTRDKVLEVEAVLYDGSIEVFKELSNEEVEKAKQSNSAAAKIYREMARLLTPDEIREEIKNHFPKASIHRRNTGYAVDALIDSNLFVSGGKGFNLAKLLAGSEGTLCFTTKIRFKIDKLPPEHEAVVCAHFLTVQQALNATIKAMEYEPFACELMDKAILDLTKGSIEQSQNRFFIEGDPGAILAIELRGDTINELQHKIRKLIDGLSAASLGYAYPVVFHPDTARVWSLRAAGLGVLSNVPGSAKPVAFVEDTAVDLKDLPQYIADFEKIMEAHNQRAIYYAHAGAGELHIRPILNLKSAKGIKDLRSIAEASAKLVKAYNGSLSGEHGDGRVRAEFIEMMVGTKNYNLFKEIKNLWDPQHIFNRGKIVFPDKMDTDLRYSENQPPFTYKTFLNFGDENMLEAAERCNGSGDCRNPAETGAAMCPSYQATRDELDTTRARANVLREVLTHPLNPAYPLDSEEVKNVLDLCISCKSCKRECPSSVDMAALKAEAMYQYQLRHGFSRRTRFFGNFHKSAAMAVKFSWLVNPIMKFKFIDKLIKKHYDIAAQRSIPPFSPKRATTICKSNTKSSTPDLVLYIDEFTEFQDAHLARATRDLLLRFAFSFQVVYSPSGRAAISKSMLQEARKCAYKTMDKLKNYIENSVPIVGIEPSGILGFKDDYLKLSEKTYQKLAQRLSQNAYTIDEFLYNHVASGRIKPTMFTEEKKDIHIQLHCHQRALSHIKFTKLLLALPKNYKVLAIPSGCCGMAGSFGYEKEHFELSNKIGELVLYPHIRKNPHAIIAATGTSCRHQIKDGVQVKAYHPVEILLKALK